MLDVLNFSIPGKPEYIQMLRLAIGSIAGKSGFDVEKIEDIKVAVAEACKLVTCHGRDGLSAKYELTVEIEDGRMQITVSDWEADIRLKSIVSSVRIVRRTEI